MIYSTHSANLVILETYTYQGMHTLMKAEDSLLSGILVFLLFLQHQTILTVTICKETQLSTVC